MDSLTVLQCYDEYLPQTQTFTYFQLRALHNVQPIVLSYHPLMNLRLFPLSGIVHYSVAPRDFSLRRLSEGALRLARGRGWLDCYRWDRIASRLERSGVSVMHAHFGPTGYLMLPLKRRLAAAMITTFYGRDAFVDEVGWSRTQLYSECDVFLAEGPALAEHLRSSGCPAHKICIHPIAIPVRDYRFREPRPTMKPVLLSAARFIEKKGLAYGLEAAAILRDRGFRFEYRIIGSGPLEADLRQLVLHRKLEDCVKFLGFLDHPRFLEELRAADIFVQPSVTAKDRDAEGGAPTTLLEAQALGVPVVSTCHADIPNVVVPGESALLAPERNAAALADHLESLLDLPERWPAMAQAGRQFVEENHDVDIQTEKLERIYSSLSRDTRRPDVRRKPAADTSGRDTNSGISEVQHTP